MKILSILLLIVSITVQAKSELEVEMDKYFAEHNINWPTIEKGFKNQLDDWGYPHSENSYYDLLTNNRSILKDIPLTAENEKVVAELEKIGDFHPVGEYTTWDNPPVIWWSDVYKAGEGDELLSWQAFNYLKTRSIEGRIDPITIAKFLGQGITREGIKDPGIQKFIIAILYPLVAPVKKNIASRNAEKDLETVFETIFDDGLDWNEILVDFNQYIDANYELENRRMRFGEKIRLLCDKIAELGAVKKWDNTDIKSRLTKSQIILDRKTNFVLLEEMLGPIVTRYDEDLHKYHSIRGAYSVAEVLIEAPDVSVAILAGGLEVNFSEYDLEKPLYQKLFFVLLAEHLF